MDNLLGQKIRKCRKDIGMTSEKLADDVGVVRTYISKIENKGHLPSVKLLKNIEMVLGVPLVKEYLIDKRKQILEEYA